MPLTLYTLIDYLFKYLREDAIGRIYWTRQVRSTPGLLFNSFAKCCRAFYSPGGSGDLYHTGEVSQR
jgi:hypothetical protein